jgi:hypothetical protein
MSDFIGARHRFALNCHSIHIQKSLIGGADEWAGEGDGGT